MAGGRPWFRMYHGDWRRDTALAMCSAATRGVWAEIIFALEERDDGPSLTGTVAQIARVTRCSESEVTSALKEIAANDVADVTGGVTPKSVTCHAQNHALVTVTSRRMARESRDRDNARERKRLERQRKKAERDGHGGSHENVTPPSSEGRGQRAESEKAEEGSLTLAVRVSENGKPFADVIDRLHAHHCEELKAYRESTGGRYSPHAWPPKVKAKIRTELKARGVEQGEADFRDAISGLFASDWHRDKNALTIQSVLNGTQLDKLADAHRNKGPGGRGATGTEYDDEEFLKNNPPTPIEEIPF